MPPALANLCRLQTISHHPMQQKQSSEVWLLAGIVVSMFLWGLSWPSGKVLSGYCSAINFSVYRYAIVLVSMVLILLATRTSFGLQRKGFPIVATAGLLLAVYSYLFYKGLKTGSPGAGGVLVTIMNPLMAYVLGLVLDRRRPTGREGAGLAVGIVAGVVLLQLWSNTSSLLDSGNLYFLFAAFTWAVMSKFTSRGGRYGSSLGFSLWQYLVTFLCMLPLADVAEFRQALQIHDTVFWGNLFFSSAIVTAGATTMYFYATTRLGAEKASSFIFLVPLCASVSSWGLLGEQIKLHTAIGGVLGITAVYIMNRRRMPANRIDK